MRKRKQKPRLGMSSQIENSMIHVKIAKKYIEYDPLNEDTKIGDIYLDLFWGLYKPVFCFVRNDMGIDKIF